MNLQRILVNERQQGNPVLKLVRNVPWKFEKDLSVDYVVGAKAGALFISIRYHLLKPQYLERRLSEMRAAEWRLRVLLCLVDIEDNSKPLHDLNLLAIKYECTLVLAHSQREAARLLECFKAYETNSAAAIKEKVDKDYLSRLTDVLTTVKPLNRTDVATLSRNLGSFRDICNADLSQLRDCSGLGDKKVANLHDVFTKPFSEAARRNRTAKKRKRDLPRR
ncbi:hypothetical protein CTAYLR_005782 [Chrysophaeum taylorii]|uniref:ERCC1-like central domain-containing protein n=1 Tax=Chrysophaeum taylorii TaxID=2483200 RepID=A0AAD7ULQ8_9STRA|nr:hypothetical protein CTAYLR_005782 [Chrysophaeum taylorii]